MALAIIVLLIIALSGAGSLWMATGDHTPRVPTRPV